LVPLLPRRALARYVVVTVVSRTQPERVTRRWKGAARIAKGDRRARALLAAPGVALAFLDLASRPDQMASWPRSALAAYAGTLALSVTLWGALLAAASTRRA
jgi:hypothetical protein